MGMRLNKDIHTLTSYVYKCGFCYPHNSYNNMYNLIIATGTVCVSELKHFFPIIVDAHIFLYVWEV